VVLLLGSFHHTINSYPQSYFFERPDLFKRLDQVAMPLTEFPVTSEEATTEALKPRNPSLSDHKDQAASIENGNVGSTVQNDGMVQQHEPANATQGDAHVQKNDFLKPDVEMSRIRAHDGNTAEQDHGAAIVIDTEGDRHTVEKVEHGQSPDGRSDERTVNAPEKPEVSVSRTNDNFHHPRRKVNVVGSQRKTTNTP
jgi:hypothetical protein